jgi:hypothetical protein
MDINAITTDIQLETVLKTPISTATQCVETYGFPSELVNKPDKAMDLAACLATPDDFNFDDNSYAPRRNPLASQATQTFLYTTNELDKRYARFYEMMHRRRKKEKDMRRDA